MRTRGEGVKKIISGCSLTLFHWFDTCCKLNYYPIVKDLKGPVSTTPRNDPNLLKDPEQADAPPAKVHANPSGDKRKFSGYKKHGGIAGNRFGTLNLTSSKAAVGSKLDKKRKKSGKDRKRNATLTTGIQSEQAAAAAAVVGSLSTSTGSFR